MGKNRRPVIVTSTSPGCVTAASFMANFGGATTVALFQRSSAHAHALASGWLSSIEEVGVTVASPCDAPMATCMRIGDSIPSNQ